MKNFEPEMIMSWAEEAFENREFVPFFQPQYNMATGLLVGAEALARWNHPEHGIIPPFFFIPVFEENGLISRLDMSIFEAVCRFQKMCIDSNIVTVPVSVNLSREDVYTEGFLDKLDEVRKSYGVPVDKIRIEITESIASEGSQKAVEVIEKLHNFGYLVELDDFGSGYSSLNVLKDIDYDIIKLDMAFMSDDMSGRGGTIVSSVVRMAKWLNMPVIAEGIETQKQAEFMKSIGCDYVQGYLYSKPLPQDVYLEQMKDTSTGLIAPAMVLKDAVNPVSFWSADSLDTLVFNSYVGGAAVFSYNADGSIEFLRVNQKYLREMGMNMTEEDVIRSNLWDSMDETGRKVYKNMLRMAIESEEEQECETWRTIVSSCCGKQELCVRSTVILIGKSEDEHIFYSSIRNITAEKRKFDEGIAYERSFKTVMEHANIYYWEYTIATKEMRPCYRCMRDLGLPPLVHNYPEPAIADGIFPPDFSDFYRDMLRQVDEGIESIEAVIPLTVGRVPFHVRYTTEFDELGRPVKSYGSATLCTQEELDAFIKEHPEAVK